ncbi:hypothetical protein T01_10846 [Trichinella spiralis]|uniref:Uncharacterized protein n=1 Tax=Trichinella spiralis TaxID=6334 RepID=A0A0V1AI29_TRISP|nr:hypothetical protein T01_10846 [Trichinella spiralis]
MSGYLNLLLLTNNDAITICIIKKSTNMYSGNYSEHIRNYGVLQNSSGLRASCFVPVEGM